jgi:hypothetical protein
MLLAACTPIHDTIVVGHWSDRLGQKSSTSRHQGFTTSTRKRSWMIRECIILLIVVVVAVLVVVIRMEPSASSPEITSFK